MRARIFAEKKQAYTEDCKKVVRRIYTFLNERTVFITMIKIIDTKNYIKASSIQEEIQVWKKTLEIDTKRVEQYKKEIGNCDDCGLTLELKVNQLKNCMKMLKKDEEMLNQLVWILNLE
jgi:predicted Zn-ribbon and HTH transcriptional regulator